MGGASFSKSKSSSEQKQESNSFGVSQSGASSRSISGGTSSGTSGGTSTSSDSIFASDMLRQLYGDALGAAGSINPGQASERVDQLFNGGASILDRLGDGGAGTDYLERRLNGEGDDALNAQIDAVGNDLGRFFTNTLNPAITGSAVAAGQLGGGRQGVAQGEAISSVLREFSTQSANLRAGDIANKDAAALGLLDRQNQAGAVGLGALPSLADIGSGSSVLDPYSQLAEIFGAPTVTTEASSQQFSEQQASEFAQQIADEFGISYDEAHSLLTAKSKGSSMGAGISIGGGGGG